MVSTSCKVELALQKGFGHCPERFKIKSHVRNSGTLSFIPFLDMRSCVCGQSRMCVARASNADTRSVLCACVP